MEEDEIKADLRKKLSKNEVTDIDALMLRRALGCPQTSFGALMAAAQERGFAGVTGFKYAFKIPENQATAPAELNMLDLTYEALPFWNIFAATSPGEWYKYGGITEQGELRFKLKSLNARTPAYKVEYLKGHNFDAVMPSISDRGDIFITKDNTGNLPFTTYYYANFGDYPFWNVLGWTTGYLGVALYKGDVLIGQGRTEFSTSNPPNAVNPVRVDISVTKENANKLAAGDKLLPKLYIQEWGDNVNNNRFFIRYIESVTPLTNIIIDDVTSPRFGGLWFIDKDNRQRSLTVTSYTLTIDYSYAVIHGRLNDYTSERNQKKYMFIQKNDDGVWTLVQEVPVWYIKQGVDTDFTFLVSGGLRPGTTYTFLVTEGVLPK